MSSAILQIDLPVRTLDAIRALDPARLLAAVAAGLDVATELTLADIKEKRLSGQGPFPADEGRLGVRSGQLRASAYKVPASVLGSTVISALGSPLVYAGIHEFGGAISRTVKAGSVRLRTHRDGTLFRRGDLATFARRRHKLVREVPYEGGRQYTITFPARAPFGHGIADNEDVFVREIERAVLAPATGGAN